MNRPPFYRVKIIRDDGPARDKGFRRGQVHLVQGDDGGAARPSRGPLFILIANGREEGFYADQLRSKPYHRPTFSPEF